VAAVGAVLDVNDGANPFNPHIIPKKD